MQAITSPLEFYFFNTKSLISLSITLPVISTILTLSLDGNIEISVTVNALLTKEKANINVNNTDEPVYKPNVVALKSEDYQLV